MLIELNRRSRIVRCPTCGQMQAISLNLLLAEDDSSDMPAIEPPQPISPRKRILSFALYASGAVLAAGCAGYCFWSLASAAWWGTVMRGSLEATVFGVLTTLFTMVYSNAAYRALFPRPSNTPPEEKRFLDRPSQL